MQTKFALPVTASVLILLGIAGPNEVDAQQRDGEAIATLLMEAR